MDRKDTKTYKIVRQYAPETGRRPKAVKHGLTLTEAQAHCRDPKTHKLDAKGLLVWFDGYTEEAAPRKSSREAIAEARERIRQRATQDGQARDAFPDAYQASVAWDHARVTGAISDADAATVGHEEARRWYFDCYKESATRQSK